MIKTSLKKIVTLILKWEAKLVLKKYRPQIIGVTGNVGKTGTKEAIAAVMKSKLKVRQSSKSYNNELGVPLTIIGTMTAWGSFFGWLKVIYRGLVLIIFKEDYPDWLILEIGADRPGDVKNIVSWIKFDIAVVTHLPDIPVHVEFFSSKDQVAEEKMALPLSIKKDGLVIINHDDSNTQPFRDKIKARILTYGFDDGSDVRASNAHTIYEESGKLKFPSGLTFKLDHAGNSVPVRVNGTLGTHVVYPILAAIAVGISQDINLVTIVETITTYESPAGRLRILRGIKDSTILDDSYNSSPAALEAGLKALASLETTGPAGTGGRKIAVIGDMMELGSFTLEAHRQAGILASIFCNLIMTVGLRAKFAADAAQENNFAADNLFHFNDSVLAGKKLQNLIKPGDIIYVKGSQSMRMEKVVEEIMLNPDQKGKLLVRQESEWLNR
ncbi:MAG: UDP-N-acetylmuramoyl-tripeptide--D-alanyl-D-alanine ligase [Patescibacteria group bacterium]